jgi:hypothetical protein
MTASSLETFKLVASILEIQKKKKQSSKAFKQHRLNAGIAINHQIT